jgi:hypothetical protein
VKRRTTSLTPEFERAKRKERCRLTVAENVELRGRCVLEIPTFFAQNKTV